MNKLTALSKLANAYHSIATEPANEAMAVIMDKFHYIRRSLRIADLMPQQPQQPAEGLNPPGPKYF